MLEKFGFIGLGSMGRPIATHVARVASLFVYDVLDTARNEMISYGAEISPDIKTIADSVGIAGICLPNLAVAENVIFGQDGLSSGSALKLVVDFSTTGAHFANETAQRLEQHGIRFVSAPVSGGVPRAVSGDLSVMAAGHPDAIAQLIPYLESFASRIFNLGETPGNGQTMKLLNNIISSTAFVASCQAMVAGVKSGLDPDMMIDVINSSTGRNNATLGKIPKAILTGTFDYGATTSISAKDADLCLAEADSIGVSLSVAKAAREIWEIAIHGGAADLDNTVLMKFIERDHGIEVRGKGAKKHFAN